MSIDNELNEIKNAVYGEEVRSSICNALLKSYTDNGIINEVIPSCKYGDDIRIPEIFASMWQIDNVNQEDSIYTFRPCSEDKTNHYILVIGLFRELP